MNEDVGILEGCVVLEGFIDREVTLNLSTVDGTAIGIYCAYISFYDYYIVMEVFMFVKPLLYD